MNELNADKGSFSNFLNDSLQQEGFWGFFNNVLFSISKIVLLLVILLIAVAYLTYMERRVMGAMQIRKGPNVRGFFGLLQPLLDGVKFFMKEMIIPKAADKWLFLLAPVITFGLAIIAWAVVPISGGGSFFGYNYNAVVIADLNISVLYLLAISSLGIYGILIGGWASNSKYSFLGAIRSSSQMISYEVSLGVIVLCVCVVTGSFSLVDIVESQKDMWYGLPMFPLMVMFFINILAETNRHPFDLPEAESELVAGYNTEYSGILFAMFFLGEYANMILMSSFLTILFLGGWYPPSFWSGFAIIPGFLWFFIKVFLLLFLFVQARATIPRYRYDQLMRLGWKVFLPLSLVFFIIVAAFTVYKNDYDIIMYNLQLIGAYL